MTELIKVLLSNAQLTIKKHVLSSLLLLIILSANNNSFSQDTIQYIVLNTITVTAQKRVQKAQDVPISMTNISSIQIRGFELGELLDLAEHVPNLIVEEGREGSSIIMRGIGNNGGTNFGFENPVGIFHDGIYFGRTNHAWLPYLDVQQIEVLRGPQGTIFGMNTIAGAISVISAKPTRELDGYVQFSLDPAHENTQMMSAVSGQISKTLSARLAVMNSFHEGYIYNTNLNSFVNGYNDSGARLSMKWNPNKNFSVDTKLEHLYRFHNGSATQLINGTTNEAALAKQIALDPDASFEADLETTQDLEFKRIEGNTLLLNAEYQFKYFKINYIPAYTTYQATNQMDIDASAVQMGGIRAKENFSQFSQELRITSTNKKSFEYLGGFYFHSSNDKCDRLLDFALGQYIPSYNGMPEGEIQTYAGNFKQQMNAFAAFAQASWSITKSLKLTGGLRATYETKRANSYFDWLVPLTSNPENALDPGSPEFAIANFVFHDVFKIERHKDDGKYLNFSILPELKLQFYPGEKIMIYGSWTKGQKSGGFNDRDNRALNFEFDPERSNNMEIGTKLEVFNGRLETNLAIFNTNYSDMQVSVFDLENLIFMVENAAKATSQGVEMDMRFLITKGIYVSGYLGWLHKVQFDQFLVPCIPDSNNSECIQTDEGYFKDEGGKPLNTPKFFYGIDLNYRTRITKKMILSAKMNLNYRGEAYDAINENAITEAVTFYNASLGITFNTHWSVSLIGKNLSNERYIYTHTSQLFAGAKQGEISTPRTLTIQLYYQF